MILAAIFIGAALVLSLWWFNSDTLPTLADWLTEVGRITGLLAGYAVVVLMARVRRWNAGSGLTGWRAGTHSVAGTPSP